MSKKSSALSQIRRLRHRAKPSDILFTESMENELEALKSRKPDVSDEDSPEITNWEKAEVGRFYRPIKNKLPSALMQIYWIGLSMKQKNTKH